MNSIYAVVPLLSAVFVFCLGVFVLTRYIKEKKELELVLSLFCFSVTFWLFGTFMMFISKTDYEAIFWDRFVYLGIAFVPALMHHFSIAFANLDKQRKYLIFAYLVSFIFMVLSQTDLFTYGLYKYQWGSHTRAGLFHHLFILLFFTYTSVFFINIGKYYKLINDSRQKNQAKYVFIAFLVLIVLGAPAYLPAYGIPVPPIPFLSGLIFIVILSYSILKHQLLDIKAASAVFFTFTMLIVFFVDIFLAKSSTETFFRILAFLIMLLVGYLLIRSVDKEVHQREKLQELTTQLAQANAHLQDLDKMKTEFVSLASHELLTPVSAIEGYLSMLLDEKLAKIEDPTAQRYLDNVYKSAKRLARLIADMLNISRIEEGRLLVEKKDVELSELIRQVIDELKFKSEERQQKIVFEGDAKWPIYADPDKIKEVVVNLVGNSIKYSKDPGTITVTVERTPTEEVKAVWKSIEDNVKVRPIDDQEAIHSAVDDHYRQFVGDHQILVRIKDQGIGIPKDELPKLFKKFHRVGDFSTAESQGTGLGLYITKALVELHHGRVWPDSEGPGKGSTFTFSLPELLAKPAIEEIEKDVPKTESLKPLARPAAAAEEI